MSETLAVNYEDEFCYNIHIEKSFLSLSAYLKEFVTASSQKICIVTDSNVANLYLCEVKKLCCEHFSSVESFVFEAGEVSKNIGSVEELYQHLINNHFDRKDFLLALGGGVVGDLTGFTAATYLRGISFIQVPTTLLSQVDSSIGGKTGVDFLQYKNMVGAFYMPKMVYINTAVLKTLPPVQFQSGMGEVIKHGLIQNASYYQWLKENRKKICALDSATMERLVLESCKIKKKIVEEDPKEHGIRAYLNFGHTFGHAVEKLSDFSLYHGQCVAIGMRGAAYLSMKNHQLSQEEYEDILTTLRQFNLPIVIDSISSEDILQASKSDKKMEGTQIKFVVLEHIGEACIDRSYQNSDLLQAINNITGQTE